MDLDKATTAKFLEVFQKIKEAENILLVTHERPDGDAVSSLCAMVDLCENLGKKYTAFCPGEPINQYSFLPHTEKIIFNKMALASAKPLLDFKNLAPLENSATWGGDEKTSSFLTGFTLIIALDCGSLERTGLAGAIRGRGFNQFFIEFDHHLKNGNHSDLEIRKPEAVATTEILYYFFKANKIKITKNIANCLLTGILTDTGNFLYPLTSDKAVSIASEMLLYGARFPQIVKNTLYNKSLAAMKLWGRALTNLKINEKYNFAFSIMTLREMEKFSEDEDIFDSIS
ncbi:MAG: DHH family phosphoesterase, partial [Patescibacteria group bacterium]|nr:DHH family phosphoesterase [Patescibacteria group bacterium]